MLTPDGEGSRDAWAVPKGAASVFSDHARLGRRVGCRPVCFLPLAGVGEGGVATGGFGRVVREYIRVRCC